MNARVLKAVFPGKYIQGENALLELPELMRLFGKRGLILASPTAGRKVPPRYDFGETGNWADIEIFNGECSEKELKRVSEIIAERKIDVIAGMGGGKTIDTAKISADRAGIPVIIVPTIASTDAPCSSCAVIYSEEGVFEKIWYQKMNPQAVLVDLSIIASAPPRFLVSGMGDALATWFEARSCERTNSMNECGGYSTMTGLALAKLCYDTLLMYGPDARMACENNVVTPALNKIVEANTLLSGIGFESSGLATAHSVHNGLTVLPETHGCYHGEKVAFGVLTGLHLTGALPAEIETVYSFCRSVGLPTTFMHLGINDIGRDRLLQAAEKACSPGEGIHHEAGIVTPPMVLNAMIAADAAGRSGKS